jgi:hypothetical protein
MSPLPAKKEGFIMKKLAITTMALVFALGLTISARAQGATEKTTTTIAQVQKATVPDAAPEAAKTEATKAAAEAKKVEPAVNGKKHSGHKGKKDKHTASIDESTTKEVKTTAVPGKKTWPRD